MQKIVLDVAGQIASRVEKDVLTRHLIALATPNERAIRNKVQRRILSELRQEGTIALPASAARDIREWVDELGYTGIDVPDPADGNAYVDTDQVDAILALPDNEWNPDVAEKATIPSLLVAHRVAGERGRTWLSKSISEVVHDRKGTVTEDDIPDEAMDEVQSEVEKRLELQAA